MSSSVRDSGTTAPAAAWAGPAEGHPQPHADQYPAQVMSQGRPWLRPAPHTLPPGAGEFAVQVFVACLDLLFHQVRMHG
jgi:hypothetical protein